MRGVPTLIHAYRLSLHESIDIVARLRTGSLPSGRLVSVSDVLLDVDTYGLLSGSK